MQLEETEGGWKVTFSFAEPQSVVVLTQAPEPYRVESWASLTSGVSLRQFGQADFIVFDTPMRTAAFDIQPRTTSLEKAYTPFLSFSDGGWGVLEGQFRFATLDDLSEAETYQGNGEDWRGANAAYTFVLSSDRQIYMKGKRASSPLTLKPDLDGRYIYVGDREFEQAANYFGVIDGGLPAWIRDQLDEDLATIFGELSSEWGLDLQERAEILFVYDGDDHPGLSQTGGVIGNQVALQVGGRALSEPDDSILDFFRWFLTHESVHLYQGAAGMVSVPDEHAWMHEGSANTMAHRIGARIAADPEAFLAEVYTTAINDCAAYLEEGAPLVDALKTGQFGAYYACGDLIGLITEIELAEGDIFDFWVRFLGTARKEHGGATSAELYFETASQMGVPAESIDWMKRFVFTPIESPRDMIITRLDNLGLSVKVSESGSLTVQNLPD